MISRVPRASYTQNSGFSLVELSIVLVILGLLVGGVLSGRHLIRGAEIRQSIAQIQSYQVAARTFREKYFYLPGDLPKPQRTQMGLSNDSCFGCPANGNGMIFSGGGFYTIVDGEQQFFWLDLAQTGLIKGSFAPYVANANLDVSGDAISRYAPASKLGGDQYIYVWSGGIGRSGGQRFGSDGINYISIGGITRLTGFNIGGNFKANRTMAVFDAFSIDSKLDDGLPQSGAVTTLYIANLAGAFVSWPGLEMNNPPLPGTVALSPSATTCMDNGGVVGTMRYTTSVNEGQNKTCALTFRF